jgi:truncated hemoglobin YjbI
VAVTFTAETSLSTSRKWGSYARRLVSHNITRFPRQTEFGSIISVIWHVRRHPWALGRIARGRRVHVFADGIERSGTPAPPTPWYSSRVEFADDQPSVFEWAGGSAAFMRLTRLFYEKVHVPADPLAPLFAHRAPDHPERVAAWFAGTFEGPTTYTDQYGGYEWMVSQHQGKALTEAQRARWEKLMCQCADEARLPTDPEFRGPSSPTSSGVADCRRKFDSGRPAADAYARAPLVVGSRSDSGRPLIRTCPPTKGASHVYTDSRRRA